VQLDIVPHFKDPFGSRKWEHHVRQSDLERFLKCPELHRSILSREVEDFEGDAAVVGTSIHHGIGEITLHDCTLAEGIEAGLDKLEELWNGPRFRQISLKCIEDARLFVAKHIEVWFHQVYPSITSANLIAVERRFDVLVYEDPFRRIYLAGTADLWLTERIVDYKNSSRSYTAPFEGWKHIRYGIQPVVYAWARDQVELDEQGGNARTLDFPDDAELHTFTWVNIQRQDNPTADPVLEMLDVTPKVADAKALLQKILNYVLLIEAGVSRWPLGASDWWCSPVWCANWGNCLGKSLGPDPWGTLEKKVAISSPTAKAGKSKTLTEGAK
jgi:hypothetical protein